MPSGEHVTYLIVQNESELALNQLLWISCSKSAWGTLSVQRTANFQSSNFECVNTRLPGVRKWTGPRNQGPERNFLSFRVEGQERGSLPLWTALSFWASLDTQETMIFKRRSRCLSPQFFTKIVHKKLRTDYERLSFSSVLGNLEKRNMQWLLVATRVRTEAVNAQDKQSYYLGLTFLKTYFSTKTLINLICYSLFFALTQYPHAKRRLLLASRNPVTRSKISCEVLGVDVNRRAQEDKFKLSTKARQLQCANHGGSA